MSLLIMMYIKSSSGF